jgi:hypothetical protein
LARLLDSHRNLSGNPANGQASYAGNVEVLKKAQAPSGERQSGRPAWGSAQSGANSSPAKFPANREKYREFSIFCPRICTPFSPSGTFLLEKIHISPEIATGS